MGLINQILISFENFLNILKNIQIIIFVIILILIYNILLYMIRDRKYIAAVNKFKDPDEVSLTDLKKKPLVNLVVPAWKEGDLFRKCLENIQELSYPNLKIIINAGGNEETIEIANSYKDNNKFLILHQKGGASRPALGKIKAINECLEYISEGLIYMNDADTRINDEIFLRVIHPIINLNENIVVGGRRPLKSQQKKNSTKYQLVNRNLNFRYKFERYQREVVLVGDNTCFTYEVLKSIQKFSEDKIYATDISMGNDFLNKGYKIYRLVDWRGRIYVDYYDTFKEYAKQKIVWAENSLIYHGQKDKLNIIRFVFFWIFALYVIIFPLFLFLHLSLFLIGLFILFGSYLRKVRKYLFYKSIIKGNVKFGRFFIIKILFYYYIENFVNIFIPFHMLYYIIKTSKRKQ